MNVLMTTACIVAGFLVVSCEDLGTSNGVTSIGDFQYTAYDTSGRRTATGTLRLRADSSAITGSWQFDDGRSGELEGRLTNDTLALNLNPGFVDNNLFLLGVLTGKTYTGRWQQVGFPGVMAEGTFSAIRK